MIFAFRQLQEKCKEQNKPLYTVFVDLIKAFDTISREILWKLLRKVDCPDKFIQARSQEEGGYRGTDF